MLEYLTRTRALDIHSKIVNHDAWSSVGILDSAGLGRCELFSIPIMEQEPISVPELVQDVEFRISCGVWGM